MKNKLYKQKEPQERYTTLEWLGGSCGSMNLGISLVRDTHTGERLICKEINANAADYEHEVAELLSQFPNIVRVQDYIPASQAQDSGSGSKLYMQYCDSGDLGDLINNHSDAGKKIPESFIWHVFYSIAKALEACHTGLGAENWVPYWHHDLHKKNVFLDSSKNGDEHPKVLLADFGLTDTSQSPDVLELMAQGTDCYNLVEIILQLCLPEEADEVHEDWAERLKELDGRQDGMYSRELKQILYTCDHAWFRDQNDDKKVVCKMVRMIEELRPQNRLHEHEGKVLSGSAQSSRSRVPSLSRRAA
ncbi:unnamed protein product [Periconia digitata]|uniref:non-specific serine/threonine protein kinase n=1 Tax=Periconia digitata TaxID=1303443 RepID=A0A9W4U9W3_9PLEO|nr:unnamed protein product [Periconia digitata]